MLLSEDPQREHRPDGNSLLGPIRAEYEYQYLDFTGFYRGAGLRQAVSRSKADVYARPKTAVSATATRVGPSSPGVSDEGETISIGQTAVTSSEKAARPPLAGSMSAAVGGVASPYCLDSPIMTSTDKTAIRILVIFPEGLGYTVHVSCHFLIAIPTSESNFSPATEGSVRAR